MGLKRRESQVFKALTGLKNLQRPVQITLPHEKGRHVPDCLSCATVYKEYNITHNLQKYNADVIIDLLDAHRLSAAEVARRGGIDKHHLLAALNWEEFFTEEDAFAIEYATGRHVDASMFPCLRLQRELWWGLVRQQYEKEPPTPWPQHPRRASFKWSQSRRLRGRRRGRKKKGQDRFFNRPAHEAPQFVDESVTVVGEEGTA